MKIKEKLNQYRQSFHLRIFLALVLIIVIFIPGTGYLGYLQALRAAEDQMEQYTKGSANQLAQRVASFLSQHSHNVNLLASLFEKELLTTNENQLLDYFQLLRKKRPEFVNIYFGSEAGDFIMDPPQRPEVHKSFDPRVRPWYHGALSNKSIHWTDPYVFASTQKLGITVSAPIYDKDHNFLGVCGIDIDLATLSRFLQSIDIGNHGIVYIFENDSGNYIAHPGLVDHLKLKENNTPQLLQDFYALQGNSSQSYGLVRIKGEQFFTAHAPYPGKEWTIGVTLSTSDYLQKIQVIKKTTFSLVIAGIFLSSILSFLLTRNIVRPLLRLQQGFERIAGGDLEHRLSIKDPTIARELAQSFNHMTLSLQKSLEELKTTYAELQEKQKLAAVGKMTAGIAHEIKNPLGIILGSTQVFLDKNRPWEMREKAASFIMDEVVRLDTTIKAFLAFAKPAAPVFKEVNVLSLLEEILSATQERFREEGYDIIGVFPDNVPLFEADPSQIRQIFMNILFNSIKAMPGGGKITVTIRVEKEPESLKINKRFISIRNPFTLARDWLIIGIKDEGCGIANENLEKIMDPFVSFQDDGIGLGLSIASQLVKLHRGHINIDSTEGKGTTFHLFFPCILEEQNIDDKSTAC